MANKDYDELMQAFMNNSQKVYNEDKETQNKNAKKKGMCYNRLKKVLKCIMI